MELLPDAETFGLLKSVDIVYFYDNTEDIICYDFIHAIILNFDKIDSYENSVLIFLDTEFDEIKTKILNEKNVSEYFIEEDSILLKDRIPIPNNLSILWFWELENNRGYKDAMQFEFYNKKNSTSIKLEFLVNGSSIEIYFLNKIDNKLKLENLISGD